MGLALTLERSLHYATIFYNLSRHKSMRTGSSPSPAGRRGFAVTVTVAPVALLLVVLTCHFGPGGYLGLRITLATSPVVLHCRAQVAKEIAKEVPVDHRFGQRPD